ncbi:DUF1187 family protein [Arsenophonus endosymbiont of Crataerina pallida]
MKYQIEATLVKDGGEPVYWYRFSDKALSEQDAWKCYPSRPCSKCNL